MSPVLHLLNASLYVVVNHKDSQLSSESTLSCDAVKSIEGHRCQSRCLASSHNVPSPITFSLSLSLFVCLPLLLLSLDVVSRRNIIETWHSEGRLSSVPQCPVFEAREQPWIIALQKQSAGVSRPIIINARTSLLQRHPSWVVERYPSICFCFGTRVSLVNA